jgi:hypothetical protein
MALFLDIHSLDEPATLRDVDQAHTADVRTQMIRNRANAAG